jgi:hypothetical protein
MTVDDAVARVRNLPPPPISAEHLEELRRRATDTSDLFAFIDWLRASNEALLACWRELQPLLDRSELEYQAAMNGWVEALREAEQLRAQPTRPDPETAQETLQEAFRSLVTLGRDRDQVIALLAALWPSRWHDSGPGRVTVAIDTPAGQLRWDLDGHNFGDLFQHIHHHDPGALSGEVSAAETQQRIRDLIRRGRGTRGADR